MSWFIPQPHVAEQVLVEMLAEANVAVHFGQRLSAIEREGRRITALHTDSQRFTARIFAARRAYGGQAENGSRERSGTHITSVGVCRNRMNYFHSYGIDMRPSAVVFYETLDYDYGTSKNKQDVGHRLAACALAKDYGFPEYIGSSPLPSAVWAKEGWVTIRFEYAAAGLEARGGKVVGFALVGADRVFHWAEAVIESPDRVAVSCSAVPEPRWVRYAWADNPLCSLYGGTGLPASLFEMAIPSGVWFTEEKQL